MFILQQNYYYMVLHKQISRRNETILFHYVLVCCKNFVCEAVARITEK